MLPEDRARMTAESGHEMHRMVRGPVVVAVLLLSVGTVAAQEASTAPELLTLPFGSSSFVPLPGAPTVYQTSDYKVRVVTVVDGLSRPWSLAFLPDGNLLVTERTGQLRIIRNDVLDPQPIGGIPQALSGVRDGLMDVVLHPDFVRNRYVYLTYTKRGTGELDTNEDCESSPTRTCVPASFTSGRPQAIALARGRFDGDALTDVRDLFVAEPWARGPTLGSRLAFGKDGMLYMSVAGGADDWTRSQKPDNHQGKVLRLRDDGTAPSNNPFIGTPGYKPEIFTLGHRNILGLAVHPETGAVWAVEMGPQGGDEINMLLPGRNYGWPEVSMGRDYSGKPFPPEGSVPGFEVPAVFWAPAIGPSGLTFYAGDTFPKWKDSVFVGGMALPHLERVFFNEDWQHTRREWLLLDLKQRIRDVREGPDGCLYVLTDANEGALLRIEPVESDE